MSALKPWQIFISEVSGVVSPWQAPGVLLSVDGRCEWLLVLRVLEEAALGTENAALLSN